jgi:hypothetical protein
MKKHIPKRLLKRIKAVVPPGAEVIPWPADMKMRITTLGCGGSSPLLGIVTQRLVEADR